VPEATTIDRQWSIPKETSEWGRVQTYYHRHDDDAPVEEGYHRARWPDGTELTIEVFYKPLEVPVSEMGHDDVVETERAYFSVSIHGAVVELPLAASGVELEVLSEEDRCMLELDPHWPAIRADNWKRRLNEVDKKRNELADKVKALTVANDKLGKRIEQLTLRAVSIVIASLSEYSDFNGPRALDEVREILDV